MYTVTLFKISDKDMGKHASPGREGGGLADDGFITSKSAHSECTANYNYRLHKISKQHSFLQTLVHALLY